MERYETYVGIAAILTTLLIGPCMFTIMETKAYALAGIVTFWGSRWLNFYVSCCAGILTFINWLHVSLYAYLMIVAFTNSSKFWWNTITIG